MTPESPPFLSIRDLAAKYPVADRNVFRSFNEMLYRWRLRDDLVEGRDWIFVKPDRPGRFKRIYREVAVIDLVLKSDLDFCCALRMGHVKAMKAILNRHFVPTQSVIP